MKEKAFILGVSVFGSLGVCYGMVDKNHPVFVIGLVLIVAGYLMIRSKLKTHIREKYASQKSEKGTRRI
jgi:uncharacterized membrane protein YfcA